MPDMPYSRNALWCMLAEHRAILMDSELIKGQSIYLTRRGLRRQCYHQANVE